MRIPNTVIIGIVLLAVPVGCQNSENATAKLESNPAIDISAQQGKSDSPTQQEEQDKTDRLIEKAADIFKKATDSAGENSDVTKKWILDKIDDATESGSVVSDDASEWATAMFKSLKDQGLTGADNATQWLTEDIRNMNAYKYKVVKVSLDDLESVEDQLNDLGQLRWECFHAVEKNGETILFLKKQRRSVLKNIPLKDMLKLIPLMGGDGE